MKNHYTFAVCSLLLSSTAFAADIPDSQSKFLKTQSQGAAYELAIAKLAEQKATSPEIKSYAQMVAADHESLNSELHKLASSKGVDLPAEMTGKQQSELKTLQGLSGSAFDSAYKKETTRINDEDKKEDQSEMSSVTDPDIRSFVQKLQAADTKHYQAGEKL